MPTGPLQRLLFLATIALCLSAGWRASGQVVIDEFTELEYDYETAEKAYLEALEAYLPGAYRERFARLSDAQIDQIAQARRLWQVWSLGGFNQFEFQNEFLKPIDTVGQWLIIEPESIRDSAVREARNKAGRLAEQLDKAYEQAGENIDPTIGERSPTGLELPALDQPHTTVDRLLLKEKSLVLAMTVGPRQSKPVLMTNADNCLQIHVEEASFTMYANKVRMLTGVNAWVANPITTACARDHSIDRKEGRASGHTSTVPGKEGLGARARRFGTPVVSEGAGGGKTGEQYIRGLSYGGGHTGPLYRSMRNVVGPGRAGTVFTSMYYRDGDYAHACQESRNELFMPPGTTKTDLETDALKSAYAALQQRDYPKAYRVLDDAEKPEDKFQRAIHRYLVARIDAEVHWWLTGVEEFAKAGDVYAAHQRYNQAKPKLAGIPAFDKMDSKIERFFSKDSIASEIETGEQFYALCAKGFSHNAMRTFAEENPGSAYAKAAMKCVQDNVNAQSKGHAPLQYFNDQSPHLNKWKYMVDVLGNGK